jgi:hypothetical protein
VITEGLLSAACLQGTEHDQSSNGKKNQRMAQRLITIDDFTGDERDVRTVTFGLNGQAYAIDLTETNAKELEEFLSRYIDAGRKEPKLWNPEPHKQRRTASGYPKGYSNKIKTWLREQGKDYPTNYGRVREDDMRLWESAHPDEVARYGKPVQ